MKEPTLSQVIQRAVTLGLTTTRVCMPGRVDSFDKDTQRAVVQPLLPVTLVDADGEPSDYECPLIYNVPVVFPSTSKFQVTFPIEKNDRCLLVFADRELNGWQANGAVTPPATSRTHDLTDAIAIMGLRDQQHKLDEFDADRPMMGSHGGPRVAFSSTQIEIGTDWDEFLQTYAARADRVDDRLTKLQQKLDSLISSFRAFLPHVHPQIGAPPTPLIPPVKAPSNLGTLESTAADRVKIK